MIGRSCSREHDVQQAAFSGRWTGELKAHAAACASCREVMLVASALSGEVGTAPRRMSPSILWAKARQARRQRAETAASRILIGGQIVVGVVGLGTVVYFGARLDVWTGFGAGVWGPALLGGAGLLLAGGVLTLRWITRGT